MASNSIDVSKWVESYGDVLFHYAKSRVFNHTIAEDLVQETFLSGFKGKDGFQGKSSEKTWLIAILKRKIIDYFRKASRTKEINVLDDEEYFHKDGIFKGFWDEENAPLEWETIENVELESEEIMNILNESLKKLPPRMASVFSMIAIEGHTTNEVCEYLNLTPSNMWVIMHRAKLQLREAFEKKWMLHPKKKLD